MLSSQNPGSIPGSAFSRKGVRFVALYFHASAPQSASIICVFHQKSLCARLTHDYGFAALWRRGEDCDGAAPTSGVCIAAVPHEGTQPPTFGSCDTAELRSRR